MSLIFIPGVESQLQNVDELSRCAAIGVAEIPGLQMSELATQSCLLVFYAVLTLDSKVLFPYPLTREDVPDGERQ